MKDRLVLSGYAAFFCTLCYVIGISMIVFFMPNININSDLRLQAILNETRLMQLWYTIIFIGFGTALVLLNRGLHFSAHVRASHLQLMSAFVGYIWAAYVFACGLIAIVTIEYVTRLSDAEINSIWPAIYAIQMGMGDGSEWFGGSWMLLVNTSMYRTKFVSRGLCLYGVGTGVIGCLTLFDVFSVAGLIFALAQIVWFCWLGISLIAKNKLPTFSN